MSDEADDNSEQHFDDEHTDDDDGEQALNEDEGDEGTSEEDGHGRAPPGEGVLHINPGGPVLDLSKRRAQLNRQIAKIFEIPNTPDAIRNSDQWIVHAYIWQGKGQTGQLLPGQDIYDSENGAYYSREQPQCWCNTPIRKLFVLSHKTVKGHRMIIGSTCMTHFDNELKRKEAAAKLKAAQRLQEQRLRGTKSKCKACDAQLDNIRLRVQRDEGYCSDVCAGRKCANHDNCSNGVPKNRWGTSTTVFPTRLSDARQQCTVPTTKLGLWCSKECWKDCAQPWLLAQNIAKTCSCGKLYEPRRTGIDDHCSDVCAGRRCVHYHTCSSGVPSDRWGDAESAITQPPDTLHELYERHVPDSSLVKWCSRKCWHISMKQSLLERDILKRCPKCGELFEPTRTARGTMKFQCDGCYKKFWDSQPKFCKDCKKDITGLHGPRCMGCFKRQRRY